MEHDQIDILDREERIFRSIKTAINLMASSPSKEIRDTQEMLCTLLEEYQKSREVLITRLT